LDSKRMLPNRWDSYPFHGYYNDKSSVTGPIYSSKQPIRRKVKKAILYSNMSLCVVSW